MTLLPTTLWGRILLIVLGGLLVAQAASYAVTSAERTWAFQRVQAESFAERIAVAFKAPDLHAEARFADGPGSTAGGPRGRARFDIMVPGPGPGSGEGVRAAERNERVLVGRPFGWRVVAALEPAAESERDAPGRVERAIRETLHTALGSDPVARVTLRDAPLRETVLRLRTPGAESGERMRRRALMPPPDLDRITVAVKLADGRYALAESDLFQPSFALPFRWWMGMGLAFVLTAAFSLWAARLAVRPVRTLAQAAERLSRNLDEPPLGETGPREVRDAAHAFNRMQDRLSRHVKTRALAFAALSHDMRTPLTRMQLRLECLDEPGQKDKLRADLDEIEALIGQALDVTRGMSRDEAPARIDLAEIAHEVAAGYAAMGHTIAVSGAPTPLEGRPMALRRAVGNLVDNAVKYGGEVSIAVFEEGGRPCLAVQDRGPGIPEAELANVVMPYYRLETSRNRDTGGAGLGLAITKDIVESSGGELVLAPRPGGGLDARIVLRRGA